MPLEIGYLLNGRYRVERILGQCGMGAVYLATDETLGAHGAVKENLNPSPDAERQFRREANLLASLRHHNLPRVTDHFILGNQQYLVMDFVEGEDLKERLSREGPLPEVDVLLWAAQICEALSYLHRLNQQYLVMDFVEGEDLKERLSREGPLPEVDVLLWAAQICEALSYLHRLSP